MKLPSLTNASGDFYLIYAQNKIYADRFGIQLQADDGSGPSCSVTDKDVTECAKSLLPIYQKCIQNDSTASCLWQLRRIRSAYTSCKPCIANSKEAVGKVLEKLATTPPSDNKGN